MTGCHEKFVVFTLLAGVAAVGIIQANSQILPIIRIGTLTELFIVTDDTGGTSVTVSTVTVSVIIIRSFFLLCFTSCLIGNCVVRAAVIIIISKEVGLLKVCHTLFITFSPSGERCHKTSKGCVVCCAAAFCVLSCTTDAALPKTEEGFRGINIDYLKEPRLKDKATKIRSLTAVASSFVININLITLYCRLYCKLYCELLNVKIILVAGVSNTA